MKKSLKIVLTVMLIIMLSIQTISLAAAGSSSGNVTLTPSSTTVKSGETFNVVVSQTCSDGIIGFEANLDYDTNLLELKSTNVDSSWTNLGENTKLEAMSNNDITSGNIFTLSFSVKEGATATTSTIKLTGIKLYKTHEDILELADSATTITITGNTSGDNGNDNNNEQSAQLSKIEITKAPNTVEYTEGDKFNPTGMVIKAVYNNGTDKEITNYEYTPNGELKTENKLITFSYQENGVTKTATQAITVKVAAGNNNNNNPQNTNNTTNNTRNNTTNNTTNNARNNTTNNTRNNTTNNMTNNTTNNKTNTDNTTTATNLPRTGARTKYILIIVAGLIGVGIVSYIGYRKYKEI